MPISIVCPNCRSPYNVPDHLAGRTVSCKRCNELIQVPGGPGATSYAAAAARQVDSDTPYDRVLGKPTPVFIEALGVHTKFGEQVGGKDVMRLIWSLRHIAYLILLIVLWVKYISPPIE